MLVAQYIKANSGSKFIVHNLAERLTTDGFSNINVNNEVNWPIFR